MWKNVRAIWKIRRSEFILYLSLTGIAWLFGNLFSGFMKDGNQFPEVLPFATMLAVICGMMMCVIGFGTDVFYGYDFFLRFCHTRKEFLLSSGAVTFLQSLIMVVVLKIFLELEMLISHSAVLSSIGSEPGEAGYWSCYGCFSPWFCQGPFGCPGSLKGHGILQKLLWLFNSYSDCL